MGKTLFSVLTRSPRPSQLQRGNFEIFLADETNPPVAVMPDASLEHERQIQSALQSAFRHPETWSGDPVTAEPHPGLRTPLQAPG